MALQWHQAHEEETEVKKIWVTEGYRELPWVTAGGATVTVGGPRLAIEDD